MGKTATKTTASRGLGARRPRLASEGSQRVITSLSKPPSFARYEPSEHDIQTAILNTLPYFQVYAWRNNSGMIAVGEGRYRRMIKLGTAGLPDIIGIHKPTGRLVGIEVKRPGNKPTVLQQQMLDTLAEYGGIVAVATSVDDLKGIFGKGSV